jgi:hypothetical protein
LQRGSHSSWDNAVVSVFFYGSFISRDVLTEHDVIVDRYEVAHLDGYDMVIQALANLVRIIGRSVYGILQKLRSSSSTASMAKSG